MKKLNKFAIVVVACLALVCLAASIVYISLYGENKKIDEAVNFFFDEIKNQKYGEACTAFVEKGMMPSILTPDQCADAVFLLQLSLMHHYFLFNQDNYDVVIEKSHFWSPYPKKNNRPVLVSIALRAQKKDIQGKGFSSRKLTEFTKRLFLISRSTRLPPVDNLLTMEREHGVWKVVRVNISGSAIAPIYGDLKGRLRLDQYVKQTPKGFVVEKFEADTKNMTPLDRMVVKYNLQKIARLVDKP